MDVEKIEDGETAAAVEFIEATVSANNLFNGGECLTRDQASEVFSAMWDAGMNVDPDGIREADVQTAAAGLGLWTADPDDVTDG